LATSGAYKNQAFTFNYALPKSSDPTAFFTGPFASGEVTYRLRNGSTLGAAVPVTPVPTFPTPSTGPFTVALTSSMMNADEVIIEFIASTSDFATRTVSIVTEPTPSDILEVQQTAVSGVADFKATGFSTFDYTTNQVIVATNNDKTGYSISGTLTTLDALDAQQDAQHSTTQSDISALNNFNPASDQVIVATNNDKTGYALSSAANDAIGAAFLAYTLTKGSPGTIERAFWQTLKTQALTDGEVSGTPGVSAFDTNLTATTGAYNHLLLLFTSGALAGEARPIDTYVSTNGRITLQEALTAAPSSSDEFIIVPDHTDPISEIQSGLATSAALAVVDSNIDAILADTGTDGVVLSSATLQSIATTLLDLSAGVESNRTLRQALRLILSASVGKLSGAATETVIIRDSNDSVNRITATVDGDGNRTSVTLNAS
jgi:hypothetical protein